VAKPNVHARVRHDLTLGHTHVAIQRLRAYLANNPEDLEARRLLAAVYRRTGNLVEAGRWAYLSNELRPEELAAFARANPHPWLRLRLLRYEGSPERLPLGARERLRDLIEQADGLGPPPIWNGPDPDSRRRRRLTFPCLFVIVALILFVALAALGVYRAVLWIIHY
jgi:hypothetical protein